MSTNIGFKIDRQAEHSVIAFHGFAKKNDSGVRLKIWDFFRNLMDYYKCPILKFGYDDGKGDFVTYNRIKNKVPDLLAKSAHFSLCSMPPGITQPNAYHTCRINFNNGDMDYCVVDFESAICSIGSADFFKVAKEVAFLCQPSYGYGYRCPYALGPTYFALGMIVGSALDYYDTRRGRNLMAMQREDKYLKKRWLRDVYPWNFLNRDFLEAPLGNLTLEQWIRQNPKRGALQPLTDTLFFWEVPDEQVDPLGKQLLDAGRVFDFDRDAWADVPPGPELSMEEATAQILGAFGFEATDDLDIRKGDNKPVSEEQKAEIKKKIPKKKKS